MSKQRAGGAPPNTRLPRRQTGGFSPIHGQVRGNSKAGGEEMAPLGRKVLLYVRFRHQPREMPLCGAGGLQSPAVLLSAHCRA